MSRVPHLPPSDLTGNQKTTYDRFTEAIDQHFGDHFQTKSKDGSLIGPFGAFMQTPSLAGPFVSLSRPS